MEDGVPPELWWGPHALESQGEMGAFSGLMLIAGIMSLFGSAMSLGLTFLHSMQGDPWVPARTGWFISNYLGFDFGIGNLFGWLGWDFLWQAVMEEPFYRVLFILGVSTLALALATRGMGRDA